MATVDLTKDTPDTTASARADLRRIRYYRAAKAALTHESVRTTGRLAVRHSSYVLGGSRLLTRRAWDGRTAARYERMLRAAEASGQPDEIKEWEARLAAYRKSRHKRRMQLLEAALKAPKTVAAATGTGAGVLLALGGIVAWANKDPGQILVPLQAVIELIAWAVLIAGVVWKPAIIALPWVLLAAAWSVGRHRHTAPQWALPVDIRDTGAPITPSIVVTALRDLGISALRKAIENMGDVGAGMLSPIVIAGCGVEVDVLLPSGVSTEEVMNRRRKLAENLGRHEHEVFPTKAQAARTVKLWIADSGALDEPIGPSPLVTDPDSTADYKNGRAPWGVDLRGDAALISLYQKHLLITGLSNQGKTASLRALALWLALDPAVEFRICDLKGIGDWSMFEGLAVVLIEGPTDEHVMDATHVVEDAFAEMQRRLLAPKGTVFPPLLVIVDEAQIAYGSGAIGDDKRPYGGSKATSRYFKAVKGIHDQGRAVNVTIWEGTQDPTNENLPKRSREGNHIRAALVLGTEEQAKMALGAKAIDGGAAPHKLRQGLDKGVIVVAGDGVKLAPGQSSITIRTHYIDDDEAAEIAETAKLRRDGVTARPAEESADELDPLADIAAVIGAADRVLTVEVATRLAALDPRYKGWDAAKVKAVLVEAGTDTKKSNRSWVIREWVLKALKDRDGDPD